MAAQLGAERVRNARTAPAPGSASGASSTSHTPSGVLAQQRVRGRLRDARLADAAGADDADQAVLLQQRAHRLDIVVAAVQQRQLGRQVGPRALQPAARARLPLRDRPEMAVEQLAVKR